MRVVMVILLVTLLSGSAFAVIYPDPDMLGFYFDQNADVRDSNQPASVPFFVYACITNPTAAEVWGLEFGYHIDVPAGMEGMVFRLVNFLPPGSIDLGFNDDILAGDYVVGLASPMPAAPSVAFVTWQFMLLAPNITMGFNLTGSSVPSLAPGYMGPAYEAGGYILPLGTEPCAGGDVVALVNSYCPIGTVETSFGSVKSLYR